jgi:hypothetical protein
MPKATYSAPSGATVVVEGGQDEVASILRLLEANAQKTTQPIVVEPKAAKNGRSTPMGLLLGFIARGFFSKPKELGAVKLALEEEGHFYPTTTLSPLMLRLVRRRELRRIKDKGHWLYVR